MLKDKYSYAELEVELRKVSSTVTEGGPTHIPIGTQVPVKEFEGFFTRTAWDLWQISPNTVIEDAYWKLSSDGKYFVKLYENSPPVPHDHRWAVYPSGNDEKISISYKQDPIITIDRAKLGLAKVDIVSAQKALLKILSTQSGVQDLLSLLPAEERAGFLRRHAELTAVTEE